MLFCYKRKRTVNAAYSIPVLCKLMGMKEKYGVGRYAIIAIIVAFLGWGFEMLLLYAIDGVWYDRGFLRLPLCPIYATAVMLTYFLLGTPQEGRGILKKAHSKWVRYPIYLLICFVVPSAVEYLVGYYFHKRWNARLWTYEHMPLQLGGYVCLPVSVGWTALLFLFMRWGFPFLKRWIVKLPKPLCNALAVVLAVLIALDTLTQAAALNG